MACKSSAVDEDLVDAVMRAPLAAKLFLCAQELGADRDDLAVPSTVSGMAASAMLSLGAFDPHAVYERDRALAAIAPLRRFVGEVLDDPRNEWWFSPSDASRQIMLNWNNTDPYAFDTPTGPNDDWETYAQRTVTGVETSTELTADLAAPIRSGHHAELSGITDWDADYPMPQLRLEVSASARVFEIGGPEDWHRLVLDYGDTARMPDADSVVGVVAGPAPTWSEVAHDWDGVHLTFFGWLTSRFVPVTADDVTTTLWSLDSERTLWLRSVFTDVTPLPDLEENPEWAFG
jgi:hypothetical protein